MIFGALDDKDWRQMLRSLLPFSRQRLYCQPPVLMAGRNGACFDALSEVAPGEHLPTVIQALQRALLCSQAGDTILVTGSIFIVGAARAFLLAEPCEAAVGL
jgi:dihydrofolate synthase/folylpolyglutamate synthase